MTLSDFNQEIYLIITTEVDKKNASKLAKLLLKEKLIPCVTFKNIESYFPKSLNFAIKNAFEILSIALSYLMYG